MNGWLVYFQNVTVWVQHARSHSTARIRAQQALRRQGTHWLATTGSTRVVDGKPGPRRPA